jgi:hypothetical protein
MSYLSDAIHQLDRSFGDVGSADFRDSQRTMAMASAMISIAMSLEFIGKVLDSIRETTEKATAKDL